MEGLTPISFEIEEPKLLSVNEQYIHPVRKSKRGGYFSYFAPSPALKELQAFYQEVLPEKISDEDIAKLKEYVEQGKDYGLELEIIIGMPIKKLDDADASNLIKSIEDCIVKRTGIDDSKNYRVTVEKAQYENDGKFKLKVTLSAYPLHVLDII